MCLCFISFKCRSSRELIFSLHCATAVIEKHKHSSTYTPHCPISPSSCCQAARWIQDNDRTSAFLLFSWHCGAHSGLQTKRFTREITIQKKYKIPSECFALWSMVQKCCSSLFMHFIFICASFVVSFHLEEWNSVWSGRWYYRDVAMNVYCILFSTGELWFSLRTSQSTMTHCGCQSCIRHNISVRWSIYLIYWCRKATNGSLRGWKGSWWVIRSKCTSCLTCLT